MVFKRYCLQSRDAAGLGTLGAVRDLEGHPLALFQGFEAVALDSRKVHEHVGTFSLLDEAEAF